jgi:hypothetical protein
MPPPVMLTAMEPPIPVGICEAQQHDVIGAGADHCLGEHRDVAVPHTGHLHDRAVDIGQCQPLAELDLVEVEVLAECVSDGVAHRRLGELVGYEDVGDDGDRDVLGVGDADVRVDHLLVFEVGEHALLQQRCRCAATSRRDVAR